MSDKQSIASLIEKATTNGGRLSIDDWDATFTQVPNLFQDPEGEDLIAFDTLGEEFEFVKQQPENKLWTVIEGDDERLYLVAGMQHVDPLNYVVTEEEWTPEFKNFEIVYFEPDMMAEAEQAKTQVASSPSM